MGLLFSAGVLEKVLNLTGHKHVISLQCQGLEELRVLSFSAG